MIVPIACLAWHRYPTISVLTTRLVRDNADRIPVTVDSPLQSLDLPFIYVFLKMAAENLIVG